MKSLKKLLALLLALTLLLSLCAACGARRADTEEEETASHSKRDKNDKGGSTDEAGKTGSESTILKVNLDFISPVQCADPGAMTCGEYLGQFRTANLVYADHGENVEAELSMEILLPKEFEALEGTPADVIGSYEEGKLLSCSEYSFLYSNRVYRITALIPAGHGSFNAENLRELPNFDYDDGQYSPTVESCEVLEDGSLKLVFSYVWSYDPIVVESLRLTYDRPDYGTDPALLPVTATYSSELGEQDALITDIAWYDGMGNPMTDKMDDGQRSVVITVAAPIGRCFDGDSASSLYPTVSASLRPLIAGVVNGMISEIAQVEPETTVELLSVSPSSLTVRITFGAEHVLMYLDPHSAGCVEDGNIACWQCAVCCRYYADKAASKEISYGSTVLSAPGHDYRVDESRSVIADCTHAAVTYWQCSRCTGWFSEVTAPALGHDLCYDIVDDSFHSVYCRRCGADLGLASHTAPDSHCDLCGLVVVN